MTAYAECAAECLSASEGHLNGQDLRKHTQVVTDDGLLLCNFEERTI